MPTEPMMLLDRLRNPAWSNVGVGTFTGPILDTKRVVADMQEAADLIERLMRLAGAVSAGESFGDLRKQAKTP